MTHIYILQLLEGITAITKTTDQGTYQDSMAAPLGQEHNDEIAAQEDGLEDDSGNNTDDAPGDLQGVLSAIESVIILLPLCKHPIANLECSSCVKLFVRFVQVRNVAKRGSMRSNYLQKQLAMPYTSQH